MTLISADEVRKLMPQMVADTINKKVERLLAVVKKLASDGKTELRCGYDYNLDPDLWIRGGYYSSPDWKKAKELLTSLGYTVTFYYKELQLVDMYTIVSWK